MYYALLDLEIVTSRSENTTNANETIARATKNSRTSTKK